MAVVILLSAGRVVAISRAAAAWVTEVAAVTPRAIDKARKIIVARAPEPAALPFPLFARYAASSWRKRLNRKQTAAAATRQGKALVWRRIAVEAAFESANLRAELIVLGLVPYGAVVQRILPLPEAHIPV